MHTFLKGSLLASFFIVLNIYSQFVLAQFTPKSLHQIDIQQIATHKQWLALLHLNENQLMIPDSGFILSHEDFSPQNELLATLKAFNNPQLSCHFIARHEFLTQQLLHKITLPKLNCPEYDVFKSKAPLDNISVLYASENLTQPSSMMGHTMLAISGMNDQGKKSEHSVSFFTELDTINVASIVWDTFYVGKEGYFTIQPLQKALDNYLVSEQRNIWRYQLDLTTAQKSLLHKHLWELRFAKIDYLFHRHNCATLSLHILKVAKPELASKNSVWVSPIDVAKAAARANIVEQTLIYPSSKWKIRMLSDFLDDKTILDIKNGNSLSSSNNDTYDYLSHTLEKTYAQFQYEQGLINRLTWFGLKTKFKLNPINSDKYQLDLGNYKSPLKTPDDSHLELGLLSNRDNKWLTFGWLPASHSLVDDNSQYFSENELKLNDVVLKINTTTGKADLHRWHLYSVKSLTPYDALTGGLSGNFSFGFDEVYNQTLENKLSFFIRGGIGHTLNISRDFNTYYLFNMGINANQHERNVYIEPEIGAYLYEVWHMKSWLSLAQRFNQSGERQVQLSIKQSFTGIERSSFNADISHIYINNQHQSSLSFQYRYYY